MIEVFFFIILITIIIIKIILIFFIIIIIIIICLWMHLKIPFRKLFPVFWNFGNGFNFALKINFALKKEGKSLKSREVHSLEVQFRVQNVSLALSSSSLPSLHLLTLASP